jgi:hypothetical protein
VIAREPLSRRKFLALAAGAGTAVAATALVSCTGSGEPHATLGVLAQVYPDRAALEAIGAQAIHARGVGDEPAKLTAALRPPDTGANWLKTARQEQVKQHLQSQTAADLRAGRLVDVAGWQLPLTEARVAALAHLAR